MYIGFFTFTISLRYSGNRYSTCVTPRWDYQRSVTYTSRRSSDPTPYDGFKEVSLTKTDFPGGSGSNTNEDSSFGCSSLTGQHPWISGPGSWRKPLGWSSRGETTPRGDTVDVEIVRTKNRVKTKKSRDVTTRVPYGVIWKTCVWRLGLTKTHLDWIL